MGHTTPLPFPTLAIHCSTTWRPKRCFSRLDRFEHHLYPKLVWYYNNDQNHWNRYARLDIVLNSLVRWKPQLSFQSDHQARRVFEFLNTSSALTQILAYWNINFKFLLEPHHTNITPHSRKNLAFLDLFRWKLIILPILDTSLIHFSLEGWENVLFELESERVKREMHQKFMLG